MASKFSLGLNFSDSKTCLFSLGVNRIVVYLLGSCRISLLVSISGWVLEKLKIFGRSDIFEIEFETHTNVVEYTTHKAI